MIIDWEKFAKHVIPGETLARHANNKNLLCIVLSNYPYKMVDRSHSLRKFLSRYDPIVIDWDIQGYNTEISITWFSSHGLYSPWLSEPHVYPVDILDYFVEGQWKTFREVMA